MKRPIQPDISHFTLGAFNPSGLKGKGPYIVSQLDGDLWAISETHLCSQSFKPAYVLQVASINIA